MSIAPLRDVRVLDVATLYAGPLAATLLGDFGADVVKIEHPKGDALRHHGEMKHGQGLWWKVIGRNKRCITLDLGHSEGQDLFRQIIPSADIVIESFRPGVLEGWDLGYECLSSLNSAVDHASPHRIRAVRSVRQPARVWDPGRVPQWMGLQQWPSGPARTLPPPSRRGVPTATAYSRIQSEPSLAMIHNGHVGVPEDVEMVSVATSRFEALGSDCELYAVAPNERLEQAARWIRSLHERCTRFTSGSELSRFNARAGQWVDVSPDFEALLRAALRAYEISAGLVHCGVLPALVRIGYDRSLSDVVIERHPSSGVRHKVVARANWLGSSSELVLLGPLPDLLRVTDGAARIQPGVALDLGGIAKGWAADRAVDLLGPNSLVNCGGDLRAVGNGPLGDGWPVAFGGRTLLLTDHGAATSATTRRRWGGCVHHLIDPRTGAPTTSDLAEVSVLARSAFDAEVLAKTALLLGSAHAETTLAGRSLAYALT